MTAKFYALLFMGFSLLGLAACTTAPPSSRMALATYEHLQPVKLDVSAIEVQDHYIPPLTAPHVEHKLINPPYNAGFNMMRRAFESEGANDVLELNIIKASVRETRVDDQSSAFRLWQSQKARQYDGDLLVEVVLRRSVPPYDIKGQGNVSVKRQLILPESMSLGEKDTALNGMVESMMRDLRQGLLDIFEDQFSLLPAENQYR